MTNTALVIQDCQAPSFDDNTFMSSRNMTAEYCNSSSVALPTGDQRVSPLTAQPFLASDNNAPLAFIFNARLPAQKTL